MRVLTFVKIVAGLIVLAVIFFTGMLAYHATVSPIEGELGEFFETIIPSAGEVLGKQPEQALVQMLDAKEMLDIEPGERSFQKAHEMLALGQLDEAREKLMGIINLYPNSSSATTARRIVGDMNMDQILSPSHMDGKEIYQVRRGDSYLGIAGKFQTSLDMIQHLNGLTEFPNLQPGDELIVMPLTFRLVVEPARHRLSLWQDGRFLRDYPVIHFSYPGKLASQKTKVTSKIASVDGRNVQPLAADYRAADKRLVFARPVLTVLAQRDGDDDPAAGIHLRQADMEELFLLMRLGNEVEIR